jgi:hypothetical protein
MSIAATVAARVDELRKHRPAPRAREISASRVIAAPLRIVQESCREAARRHVLHTLGSSRITDQAVHGAVAVGPFHHLYRATIAAEGDAYRWMGDASRGTIRFTSLDAERTRVDVVAEWRPTAPWAHLAAGADLDRRQIEADLHRVALIAESEAAEERLGPLGL